LSRLTEAASRGSYELLGDLWIESLGTGPSPEEMIGVFSILSDAGRHDLAEDLLAMAVEEMDRAESPLLPALLEGAAPFFHASEALRRPLVETLRDTHLMFQPLELFLRRSGLGQPGADVSACWREFGRLMRYDEGGSVFHPTFGPGRIRRISRTGITIDFQKARDHEMNLDIALETTVPVSADSPVMLRWTDPEALGGLLREEPEILLERLLDEAPGTPGELTRNDLVPVFGDSGTAVADAWKILKKTAADMPGVADLGDTLARRTGSMSPVAQIRGILGDRRLPASGMTVLIHSILGSESGITDADREVLLEAASGLTRSESGALFELAWILSDSGRLPGFERVAGLFLERSAARVSRAIGEISASPCRRLYLESFLSGDASREEKIELLARLKRPQWERAARFLESADPSLLTESLARFLSDPRETDGFLWALAYCAESGRREGLPEEAGQVELFLRYLVHAKADTQKRVITLLLSTLREELDAHLRRSDTRRLLDFLETIEESTTAHREGLHLAVTRELSRRKETAPRAIATANRRFWESDHLFAGPRAIQARLSEMKRLRFVEIPAAAEAIGEAASHGDLSENAEYAAAMERRDLLLGKLARWEEEMGRYRPYPVQELSPSLSSPGTRITLRKAGEPDSADPDRTFEIVGPLEADPEKGRINYLAPLGAVLVGHAPGDLIELPGEPGSLWEIEDVVIPGEDE